MLKLIQVKTNPLPKSVLREYERLNPALYQKLIQKIKKIKGKVIIHINSTSFGGGVAEILKSQVPLERSLGIKSYWLVVKAPRRFFVITKKIHNFLQEKQGFLTEEEKAHYLSIGHKLGKFLQKICQQFDSGIVVIHDPQPLPLTAFIPENFSAILRLHLDLTAPNPSVLEFLRPPISNYSRIILSSRDYLPFFLWLKKSKIKIIPPAIDPFSDKNKPMSQLAAEIILQRFGINCSQPIIAQISRFDSWKDPLGVIQAYYLAKNKIPELQLVLAGFEMAQDDPEAGEIFKHVKKHARGDPDIFLFSNPNQLKDISNDIFINALNTASTVIIQKSIREGFGLTITEAMWEGKAVVAGKTSGALSQVKNNINGILVSSPTETARAIVRLLKNKNLRERLGKKARQSVRQKFLLPRLILNMAQVYAESIPISSEQKT